MCDQFQPITPLPAELRPAPGPTAAAILAGIDAAGHPHFIDLSSASQKTARRALRGLWRALEAEGGIALRSPQLLAAIGELERPGGQP